MRTALPRPLARTLITTLVHAIMVVVALCAMPAGSALGASVQELTRIQGQGESVIRGVGLVIGLPGTGDSSKDLTVARPLIALLQNNGQAVGAAEDLTRSRLEVRSIALVSVTAVVPREGSRTDDKLDVTVSTLNTATSLRGGELYLTPLQGPLPGSPVYAIAAGRIEIEGDGPATVGRVRGAARMVQDVLMPAVGDQFNLIIEPPFAGWPSATMIADAIQSSVALTGRLTAGAAPVAQVLDERTIRITIPREERGDRAAFVADVLASEVRTELLDLPAQVVVNTRTGAIIVTGDVTISPVAITHKDLSITTTVAPAGPGNQQQQQQPTTRRDRWAGVRTGGTQRQEARLADLLSALKNLDVPVQEQIAIIQMLHRTGKLHARLIVE